MLEKNPQRVCEEVGVNLTNKPQDLAYCDHILCTASTLVNDTLETLLDQRRPGASFSLIGPSGNELPDVLFELGVDSAGGVSYLGAPGSLRRDFAEAEYRSKTGRKYQIQPTHYPGIEALPKAC